LREKTPDSGALDIIDADDSKAYSHCNVGGIADLLLPQGSSVRQDRRNTTAEYRQYPGSNADSYSYANSNTTSAAAEFK
jgi:hypothetical protein